MWTRVISLTLPLLACVPIAAQTVADPKTPAPSLTKATKVMDRPEVRIMRVEMLSGGERPVHTHEDARFHLYIPVSGAVELTIGSDKPIQAVPGQAYYMVKGTPHSFKNVGSTPAMVMEVFIKDTDATASKQ